MAHLVLLIAGIWILLAGLLALVLGPLIRGPRPRNTERRKK